MRLSAALRPLRVPLLLIGSGWRCVPWRLAAVCPQQWGSIEHESHSNTSRTLRIVERSAVERVDHCAIPRNVAASPQGCELPALESLC